MNPKVDAYIAKAKKWREELKLVRNIILDCHLTEDFKWNKPCYTLNDSNIVILLPLKNHFTLLFCKGVLLKDPKKILIRPGEYSQSARQARFTSVEEITKLKTVIKAYIKEAIEAEKAGLKVEYKNPADYKVPEELQNRFDKNPKLQTAFKALTPGRQRMYVIYFTGAKQSKTRESRIDKYTQQILNGKGMNDV